MHRISQGIIEKPDIWYYNIKRNKSMHTVKKLCPHVVITHKKYRIIATLNCMYSINFTSVMVI